MRCRCSSSRGNGAEVRFDPGQAKGNFTLNLEIVDGDPDIAPFQILSRIRDPESGIQRTMKLYMGGFRLDKLLVT